MFREKKQQQRALKAFEAFLSTSIEANSPQPEAAQTAVLNLFHDVAATVPAYGQFLQQHQIEPNSIQSFDDFQSLPLTTKANYLQPNNLAALCRQGELSTCDMIAVSSGSTGKPTFWPRFLSDEFAIATRFEQIFYNSFAADQKSTLAVVCFALGTWVGGMYTASCCRHLAAKGYPITVVTPGNNPVEILRVVRELGTSFEQVVLLGYPPFLKDIIDRGASEGIQWQNYSVKLVMAGEVFSEEWRTLVGERLGSTNFCYDFASLYGTADAGVLGNETPLSICIRRWLAEHPQAARQLFGESRLPTLVQYDPTSRFFETVDDTLLFSGDNGVPLIRYHIADTGGIISYEAMLASLQDWGFEPLDQWKTPNNRGVEAFPFVYVFGRSQFIVSYFGANIYPENISVGLEQPEVREWVTGKFVMEVGEDADKNRFLAVAVELAPGIQASHSKQLKITEAIQTQLLRLNSEFAHYVPPQYQQPHVTLMATGDPQYFPPGVKHRYTRS